MRIQQRWPIVRDSNWLGTGGFKNFLREVVDGNVRLSLTPPGFVFDPQRHKAPNHLGELTEPMRDLVERLYVVVGLPRLHPRQYQALFKALESQRGHPGTEKKTSTRPLPPPIVDHPRRTDNHRARSNLDRFRGAGRSTCYMAGGVCATPRS